MALSRSTAGGGDWFKPAEHMTDTVILIEPVRIEKQVPDEKNGGYRDIATATFSIFQTQENVDTKTPSEVQKDHKLSSKALASEIEKKMGEPFVAIIKKIPMGQGSGYVFRSSTEEVPDSTFDLVAAYLEERDAQIEADMNDAPDFD